MDQSAAVLTPNSFVKTLSIIHLGLLAGPFLFGVVAYYQTENAFLDYTNTEDVFLFGVPIFAVTGIFVGNLLFKQMMTAAMKTDGLRPKLARFQTASLVKYALIEGPALIGTIAFLNTGNLTYLYISGVLILFLYLLRPTKEKIELGLDLKGDDKNQFNKLNQPIP
ncbi:hypothetical protein [Flagellimonas algicola]|uniref:MFS transporter n=1 Tax=Flagellimonas algicola TaxID=2583815 RepID=A0ABY2WHX1_9FLAO|nr:hypothetical protein [Allomuricauda algicola]TMU50916.1 hypothetical protein FGG15_16975 [Allomuricauda algicola]